MRTIRLNHCAGALLALACLAASAQPAAGNSTDQATGGPVTQSSAMERARALARDAGRASAGQQAAASPCAAQRMTVSHCVFDVPATPSGQGAAVMNKTVGFIGVIAAACTNGSFKVRDSLCDANATTSSAAQADIDAIVRNTDWSSTASGGSQGSAGAGESTGSGNVSNNISGTALTTYAGAAASYSGPNSGAGSSYAGLSYAGQVGACERGGVYDPFRLIVDASATDEMIASAIEKSFTGPFPAASFSEVAARLSYFGIGGDRLAQVVTKQGGVINAVVGAFGGYPHGWPTCNGTTPRGLDAAVHADMCGKFNGPGAAAPAAKWQCDTPAPGTAVTGSGSQVAQAASSEPAPVVCTEGVGQFANWSVGGNTCTSEVPGASNADNPARLQVRKAGGSVLMLQQIGAMRGDALYVCGADGKWTMTSAQCAPASGCEAEFRTDVRSENSSDTCSFMIDTRGRQLANGATATMTNVTPGTIGGATAMCRNGTFELVSSACKAGANVAVR